MAGKHSLRAGLFSAILVAATIALMRRRTPRTAKDRLARKFAAAATHAADGALAVSF